MSHDNIQAHVKTYIRVFMALMFLTIITVYASYIDFDIVPSVNSGAIFVGLADVYSESSTKAGCAHTPRRAFFSDVIVFKVGIEMLDFEQIFGFRVQNRKFHEKQRRFSS